MKHRTEERESIVLENEGQKIFGIFHRPLVESPFPAVLICHGLGGHKSGKYRLYVTLAELLSQNGIASLRIDFRGCGDSEGEFGNMTLESETSDAVLALQYLKNRSDVDKNRIGIFGRSVGGTVSILTAEKFKDIKSLATWAPLFDGDQWVNLWHELHKEGVSEEFRHEHMKINGQVPGNGFFTQLFNLDIEKHLNKIANIPMLHIHGDLDVTVVPYHRDKYQVARQLSSAENKFINLKLSDHDFSHTEEQRMALDETVDWFARTL